MCGIAGILTTEHVGPPTFDELRAMIAMLRHRGPDEYGLYRDEHVGLAHARLSIIDLVGGTQPVHNEDESIWVAFNGEIFNYIELRQELEQRGHRFYTRSDTEVIVHSYEEFGAEAWRRFNGQFALALWDQEAGQLWLVRDRLGILPLYHSRVGDRVLFGSEIKAILASGHLQPRFDPAGIAQVFVRWAVMPPATVFAGVASVAPGSAVCFDRQLRPRATQYWQPDFTADAALADLSVEDAADALAERLTRAVRLRLRADVPVGAYLSGGLDSSVIAWLIRRLHAGDLQTYAIRFASAAFDETEPQRRMVRLLGTRHHEILCGSADIRESLPDVIWHTETPLLRTAPVPLFRLSDLVRTHGMKVVLTGEGADELLAGYDIFKEDKLRRFWARRPASRWRGALFTQLYQDVGDGQQDSGMWAEFFRRDLTNVDDPFYAHRIRWENTAWGARFLSLDVRAALDADGFEHALDGSLPSGWHAWEALAQAQAVELATFLSPYLLCSQGDRVALAHGVEVRYPFLDPDVVDFCCRLPSRLKLRGLHDKVTLRALARRELPPEIWARPKRPYRAPMTRALFGGPADGYVAELLSPQSLDRFGLVDTAAATRLVAKGRARLGHMSGEREEMALVGLLTLQLLAREFYDEFASRTAAARTALDRAAPRLQIDRVAAAAPQLAAVG